MWRLLTLLLSYHQQEADFFMGGIQEKNKLVRGKREMRGKEEYSWRERRELKRERRVGERRKKEWEGERAGERGRDRKGKNECER